MFTVKKVKYQTTEWDKLCANYISNNQNIKKKTFSTE